VTAYRWDPGDPDSCAAVYAMLMQAGAGFAQIEHMGAAAPLEIWFLGRKMTASPGDWVVRGTGGVDVLDPVAFAAAATVPGAGGDRM